jgi:soluble lytic murein transglycosylase-like protein
VCFGATKSAQKRAMVRHYAAHYNVPQELISALIEVESAWNPRAVSDKGMTADTLIRKIPDIAIQR